jgi:molecular chaperone GrpE
MKDNRQADENQKAAETDEAMAEQAKESDQAMDEVGSAGPEPSEPEAESTREHELQAELEETRDRLLRALAEMENLRRRKEREVEDARKYAMAGFARELLDVADNLSRALDSIPPEARESDLLKNLIEGVAMTEKALLASFERHRISKVTPEVGARFDHNLHQAMFEVTTDQQPPGTVAQVMQPGYVIADRLLRPAMVGVAKAPAAAPDAAGRDETSPNDDDRVVRIRRE